MTRKLLVFFAACVAVAFVSIGIASWIGLPDEEHFEKTFSSHKNIHWHWSNDDESGNTPDTSPRSTKSYVWNGTDALDFNIPVSVRYVKAATPSLLIEAPENLHKILRVEKGNVDISGSYHANWSDNNPTITISGPSVPPITVNNVGDVELTDLNQQALNIKIHGAGSVEATGRVQKLDVNISGAGSGDFEHLQAQDIVAELNGAGSVDLRGSGNVDVQIHGAGSAALHQKPKNLTSGIYGIGSITNEY